MLSRIQASVIILEDRRIQSKELMDMIRALAPYEMLSPEQGDFGSNDFH
jgi:hypothetical protein